MSKKPGDQDAWVFMSLDGRRFVGHFSGCGPGAIIHWTTDESKAAIYRTAVVDAILAKPSPLKSQIRPVRLEHLRRSGPPAAVSPSETPECNCEVCERKRNAKDQRRIAPV